jgi:hypothetical protein
MIKIDWHTEKVSVVSEPPKLNQSIEGSASQTGPTSVSTKQPTSIEIAPYRRQEAMAAVSRTGTPSNVSETNPPSISIGAIDNSLSWPWKHPDAVSLKFSQSLRCLVADVDIVAILSIWVVVSACLSHRSAFFEGDS